MVFTVIILGFIAFAFIAALWVDISDHLTEKRHCPACHTGTVMFTDEDDALCYPHYRRRQHIKLLEWKMDHMDE